MAGQTTWNKATVPAGTDPWNGVPDWKKAAETSGLVFGVANTTERNGLAALAPGGILPIPTVIFRADAGSLETWDGTKWFTNPTPKRKFVAGTATGSLPVASGWIAIAADYTTPANPFGVGVPYEIEVNAQSAPTAGAGGAVAMRVMFNAVAADGGQSQTPVASTGTLSVQGSKHVSDGSAQTVSVQISALTSAATLSGGSAIYWYKVTMRPVVNL